MPGCYSDGTDCDAGAGVNGNSSLSVGTGTASHAIPAKMVFASLCLDAKNHKGHLVTVSTMSVMRSGVQMV